MTVLLFGRWLKEECLRVLGLTQKNWSRGVPGDTLHCKPSTSSYRSSLNPYVYPALLIPILRSEVRSLFGRIRAIRDTKPYHRGLVIAPEGFWLLDQGDRKATQDAYIFDTERLRAARPHLTAVDEEVFYQGWRQGFDWALRIAHKQAVLQEHQSWTDLTEISIPEYSKRGRLNLPPYKA